MTMNNAGTKLIGNLWYSVKTKSTNKNRDRKGNETQIKGIQNNFNKTIKERFSNLKKVKEADRTLNK